MNLARVTHAGANQLLLFALQVQFWIMVSISCSILFLLQASWLFQVQAVLFHCNRSSSETSINHTAVMPPKGSKKPKGGVWAMETGETTVATPGRSAGGKTDSPPRSTVKAAKKLANKTISAAAASSSPVVVKGADDDTDIKLDVLRVSKLNAEIIAGLLDDLEAVGKHPKIAPILNADPLQITDDASTTGSQEPWTDRAYSNAIKTGEFRCGDNFFKIDHGKSGSRGVPYNSEASHWKATGVHGMSARYFDCRDLVPVSRRLDCRPYYFSQNLGLWVSFSTAAWAHHGIVGCEPPLPPEATLLLLLLLLLLLFCI
jgi:hypothetical protein